MAFSSHLPNANTAEICFRQHDWEKSLATTNDGFISYSFEENPTISRSTFVGREQKESDFEKMQERASYNEKTSLLITKSQVTYIILASTYILPLISSTIEFFKNCFVIICCNYKGTWKGETEEEIKEAKQ